MSDLPPGWGGWIAAGVASIIAALGSAVSFLYKRESTTKERELTKAEAREAALLVLLQEKKKEYREEVERILGEHKKDMDRVNTAMERCEREREEFRVELTEFKVRIEMLEARQVAEQAHSQSVDRRLDELSS